MHKFKNALKVAAGSATALAVSATGAFAEITTAQQTEIQTGIAAADGVFYAIGGSILVVLAGIWGFKLVKRLLG